MLLMATFFLCFFSGCASDNAAIKKANAKAQILASKQRKKTDQEAIAKLNKEASKTNEEDAKVKGPYKMKIGDIMEISVMDELEMTKEVPVIPDGSITYLLVGEVPAMGKTVAQLRKKIEDKLEEYFKDPQVSIILKKVHLQSEEPEFVSTLGALKQPGRYELYEGETLAGLIARAGGFLYVTDTLGGRTLANLKASYISRNGKKLPVDFYALFEFGNLAYDIKLQADDFVYIANAQTEQIYILGEVNTPRLLSYNRDISLIEAISSCGGFTKLAQRTRVIVIRGKGQGKENHINVDVEALLLGDLEEQNIALHSGDIIFVPEQGLSEYSRYAKYLMDFADLILRAYQVREAVLFPKLSRFPPQ